MSFTSNILIIGLLVLSILAWLKIVSRRREDKNNILYNNVKKEPITQDDEYHNDFSKVPAGEPDGTPLVPRSIGYGYGDHGRSFEEDLEKLSQNIIEDKEKNTD